MSKDITDKYAELDATARTMNVREFAKHVNETITLWGNPLPAYSCVKVGPASYLWNLTDGKYDGWDCVIVENIEQ